MNNLIKCFIIFVLFLINAQAFSLHDGFKFALENDMDSKVNENNLKSILLDQDIADSLLLPTIDFTSTINSSSLSEGKLTPGGGSTLRNDEYMIKITQPIFDGYESKYETKLQKENYKSAVYSLKEGYNKVALDYLSSYIDTLKQKDLISLVAEDLAISEEIFNKVHKKVSSGYGTKFEFVEAKGALAEAKVNLNIQKINLKNAIEKLKFYVQTDFDTFELTKPNFTFSLPKHLDKAIKIALNNNPSINVTKANLIISTVEKRKLKKSFLPDVKFVSSYSANNALYAQKDEKYNQYKFGFEVKYNLYNGGKDTTINKKAIQTIKEKKYLIQKSEYEIKNKMRLAWNSYKLNKEKQNNLEQYVLVKKDILDASLKEFDLGSKDLNSVLELHSEYIDVKKDLISNSYDLLLAQYNILDSLGFIADALQNKIPSLDNVKNPIDIISRPQEIKEIFTQTGYTFNVKKALSEKKIKRISFGNKNPKDNFNSRNEETYTQSNDLLSLNSIFKDRFLSASKEKYTINLACFSTIKNSEKFLNKYNLNDTAFYFSFGKEKVFQKVVMGIYDTKEDALKAFNALDKKLKQNKPIVEKITKKQKLYFKYHALKDVTVKKQDLYKATVHKTSFTSLEKQPTERKIFNRKLDELSSFKDKFLSASKDKYTINLAYFGNIKNSQKFLDKYHLNDTAFYFGFGKVKTLQKVVMGVYDTRKNALIALNNLDEKLKQKRPIIERITKKQKLYFKYHPKQEIKKEVFVEKKNLNKARFYKASFTSLENKPTARKVFSRKLNNVNTFKDKFLSASKEKYTINLACFSNVKNSQKFLDKYKLDNNAFYFEFGKVKTLQKVVMGVYNTRKDALIALNTLDEKLKRNKPIIEKITKKQKLYFKYNSYDYNQQGSI